MKSKTSGMFINQKKNTRDTQVKLEYRRQNHAQQVLAATPKDHKFETGSHLCLRTRIL